MTLGRRLHARSLVGLFVAALILGSFVVPVTSPAGAVPASPWDIDVDGLVLAMVRDGNTLYIGGDFTSVNGLPRQHLAAVDLTTRTVTDWVPEVGSGVPNEGVLALAIPARGGAVFVGGTFDEVNGEARNDLAAISTDLGGVLLPWNPTPASLSVGYVNALATDRDPDGFTRVFVGGRFATMNGEARDGLAAVLLQGNDDVLSDWHPVLENELGEEPIVDALTPDPWSSRIFVGGSFVSVNGDPRMNLAAVTTDGTGDATSWNPGADATVWSFSFDPAGGLLYVGGSFDTLGGTARSGVGAVSSEGTGAVTQWFSNPGPFGCGDGRSALALNPQRTEVIVGCASPRFGTGTYAYATGAGQQLRSYPASNQVFALAVTPAGRVFTGSSLGLAHFTPPEPVELPTISVGTASIEEGDTGARLARVTVALSKPVAYAAAAHYIVRSGVGPGAAIAGSDFVAESGWLTIPAGSTSAAISVKVLGDTVVEEGESFQVALTDPQSARLHRAYGAATITNDDRSTARRIGIGNAGVAEGNEGKRDARFTISLSRVSSTPVSVTYFTVPGTAADTDFTMRWGVATIPAGALSTAVTVPVVGDTTYEGNERYGVKISQPQGASLGRRNATGTIYLDDHSPDS
jgi:hypothetical protein